MFDVLVICIIPYYNMGQKCDGLTLPFDNSEFNRKLEMTTTSSFDLL